MVSDVKCHEATLSMVVCRTTQRSRKMMSGIEETRGEKTRLFRDRSTGDMPRGALDDVHVRSSTFGASLHKIGLKAVLYITTPSEMLDRRQLGIG